MRIPLLFPLLLVAPIMLLGCLPTSDNPLPLYGDITAISAPYLGHWTIESLLAETNVAECSVDVSLLGTTELQIDFVDASNDASFVCTLHEIEGTYILTRNMGTELVQSFDFYKLILDGNTLLAYPLDMDRLEAAITLAEIEGQISEIEGTKKIRITDSSASIEAYVENNSNAFSEDAVLELQKVP